MLQQLEKSNAQTPDRTIDKNDQQYTILTEKEFDPQKYLICSINEVSKPNKDKKKQKPQIEITHENYQSDITLDSFLFKLSQLGLDSISKLIRKFSGLTARDSIREIFEFED